MQKGVFSEKGGKSQLQAAKINETVNQVNAKNSNMPDHAHLSQGRNRSGLNVNDYNSRPGTNITHGSDFEQQMMAYLAVICINEREIRDWWVASNVAGLGAFDDAVLYIEYLDSHSELYLIQLKHREDPSKKKLTISELEDKQYLQSFQQIRNLMSKKKTSTCHEITKTLFHNSAVPIKKIQFLFLTNTVCNVEHACLKKVQNSFFFATNPHGQAYQLDPELTESTDEKMFRSQFYILTDQISANSDDLLKEIASEVKTYFNSNTNFNEYLTVAKELTDYIHKWFKGNSKTLTFQHFKVILSKLMLSKFVQKPVSDREYHNLQDHEFVLWEKIIAPFQLVVFQNESSESQNFFHSSNSHLLIKCDDNCIDIVIKCLSIDKEKKVLLKKSINSLTSFQQRLDQCEIQTFKCLSNLSQTLINILGECCLWLQGKEVRLKSLLSLDLHIASVFNVDDVISLLSNTLYYIGDHSKQISYYVPRSMPRILLKKSIIAEKPNSYFIIIVETNFYKECVAKLNNVIKHSYTKSGMETKQENFLAVANKEVKQEMLNVNKKYNTVHVLAFHKYKSDFLLEWVTSNKNVNEIESFFDNEIQKMQPIGQNEIDLVLNCSEKVLILGNPGMGKSIYLRFLAKKYPTDSWIVFVTLNELDYSKINNFPACLDNSVNKMNKKSQQIFNIYLNKKSVVVLFDGFDEIAPDYEDEGLKIIKEASEMGLKIVVTSRYVKRTLLEKNMDILSRTLQPFSDEDKTQFLENFYTHEVENINKLNVSDLLQKVKHIVVQLMSNISLSRWDADFMGVPLQCRLIAESFVDEFVEYCENGNLELSDNFNLLSLYERFIDNKFNIFWREKEDQPEKTSSQKCLKIREIELFTRNHMAAAVQIIFPSLHEKISREYLESIRNGEEKRGIITGVDSNDNPVFIHRTFAEYFAAKWLVDIKKTGSEEERTKYLKNLLSPEHNVVRDLFDRLVCRDCELHTAVLNADKEEMLRLLERDGRVEERKCGRSTFHLLSARGARHEWGDDEYEIHNIITRREEESHLEVLELLLSSGVCDAGKDQVLGWTAQQYAEDRKAFGVIDIFIKYNQFNRSGSVLIPERNMKKFLNVVLRRKGKSFPNNKVLLEMCCVYDYVNLAANVVDLNSSKMKKVEDWLKICVDYDSVQFAEKLIKCRGLTSRVLEKIKCEYRFSVNRKGSLLHVAALSGSRAVLELLLGYIHVDIRDRSGRTAFYYACIAERSLPSVQLLLSRGADLFAQDDERRTTLHGLTISRGENELKEYLTSFDVLKAAYGDDVNAILGDRTALQWAIEVGNWVSVQQLLREGAEPNVKDSEGRTPLHWTCQDGNVEVVRLLLEAGAELDVQNEGWKHTALHEAAGWGNIEVVEELVQSGANTDILDNTQCSALILAREQENKETFLYLWPHTLHHTTDDIRYHTELTEEKWLNLRKT